MSSLVDHVVRLGGVATRGELLSLASRAEIADALADGSIHRPRRGRYVLPQATQSLRVAHQLAGVVALRSAALTYGWKVRTVPALPEVIVPRSRKVRDEARTIATLRRSALGPQDAERGVTAPLRTVIDCARHLPFDEALSVADSALRSGLLRSTDLARAATNTRGAGRSRVLRVLENAHRKAANPFESSLRAIALDVPGLRVVPQVGVIVAGGARVAPDLVDVDLGSCSRRTATSSTPAANVSRTTAGATTSSSWRAGASCDSRGSTLCSSRPGCARCSNGLWL